MSVKSVVLCILDGWGNGVKDSKYNAISNANPTFWKYINSNFPKCNLSASETDVGLPKAQVGNSEVGHMNIGSGRIVMQNLERINREIESIDSNRNFRDFVNSLKVKNGICHILGLVSNGGVHSHQKHISILANKISQYGVKVVVHAFLDGRDTSPCSAVRDIEVFQCQNQAIKVVTICGRYYAMDRDNRLERTIKAYEAIAFANAPIYSDAISFINENYQNNTTDEFMKPAVIGNYHGIKPEDGLLIANFRSDRVKQLLDMLLGKVNNKAEFSSILGMIQYSNDLDIPYLFSPLSFKNTLGEIIADHELKQLRISETEKYAHVTFFFSCGKERPFPGEKRILIPSPKVSTYDLHPEMSAFELTEMLVSNILSKEFSLIVVNYANPDMVGHTGDIKAAEKAVLAVDSCLSKVFSVIEDMKDTVLVITADHGNVECMFDEENNMPHTAHTLNKVPFIICKNSIKLRDGRLSDIAPTVLELLDIKKPDEMTGTSLIYKIQDNE
ncbi:2,3-bisphosphoglycerate-independent phosphoglycerate mutase [Wolbachia endosymbiont of Pentidionis agamae]|uniref:2,3-bisphosphoglycerate-independent phosphoglycerate mutase n=1 Tax=Wolbachia endosymbiont of Pentidionis agamae TaxID=3110435 RepID=UPI002FD29FFB